MPEPSPRERILLATVEAIEAVGVEHVTVRQITERAGVNVASVSYWFGGKEALLEEALAGTLRETFDQPLKELDAALSRGTPPGVALVALLADQIRDSRAWPGIARAHLFAPAGDDLTEKAAAFLDALADRLAAAGWKPAATSRLGLAQLWTAVVLGAVAPRFVDGISRLDLSQPKHRERYVKALVRAHLPGLLPEK
jgi:AcrR family transcriptional regulator